MGCFPIIFKFLRLNKRYEPRKKAGYHSISYDKSINPLNSITSKDDSNLFKKTMIVGGIEAMSNTENLEFLIKPKRRGSDSLMKKN